MVTTNHKPEKKERKKRNTKQLKEIQGRKGQGPIDYSDLLRHFTVQINFMDLAQMSPDFAKNVRSLITRVNEKRSKKKKKSSKYEPPTVEAVEEEEEILATEATVESNTTEITVETTANSTPNSTANSTDLPVSRGVAFDPSTGPQIESIPPKAPSKSFTAQPTYEESKPLIGQPSKDLQLKANLVNLHGGVPYKSLGGKKRTTFTQNDCTGITQKDRHNSAIPTPFHRDRIKLQTSYLATEYKQRLPAYQNLYAGKAKHRPPKSICKGAGAWVSED